MIVLSLSILDCSRSLAANSIVRARSRKIELFKRPTKTLAFGQTHTHTHTHAFSLFVCMCVLVTCPGLELVSFGLCTPPQCTPGYTQTQTNTGKGTAGHLPHQSSSAFVAAAAAAEATRLTNVACICNDIMFGVRARQRALFVLVEGGDGGGSLLAQIPSHTRPHTIKSDRLTSKSYH